MIFKYTNYSKYLKSWISSRPKGGRGLIGEIAEEARVSRVLFSLILSGERSLSMDQGWLVSEYIGHTRLEKEYFLSMIELQRAGNSELKKYIKKRMEEIKAEATKLSNIVDTDAELDESTLARFYSTWHYTAIRALFSINPRMAQEEMCEKLNVPKESLIDMIDFLIAKDLLKVGKNGYLPVHRSLHLDKDSPYFANRQASWRNLANQKVGLKNKNDLFISVPASISKRGAQRVNEEVKEFTKRMIDIAKEEKPEEIVCLNIDLFRV